MSETSRPRVLVVGDHPSLHRGFATIVRAVTAHLHARGWPVEVLGYYPPDPAWRSPGYAVTDLDPDDVPRSQRVPRLVGALGAMLRGSGRVPPTVLCIGTDFDLGAVVEALRALGLREKVTLVGYTPIDYAPLPVAAMEVLGAFDRLVPYTQLAHEALVDCARRAGIEPSFLTTPIPHGVDTACFRPLPPAERAAARRTLLDIDDDTFLVGYFGRNSRNKRIDIVLRLFALAASGNYARCARCGSTSACALDRDGRPLAPPPRCNACGGADLSPGRARDDLVLYVHADLDAHRAPQASGGRNLLAIADALGVRDRVRFRDDLRIGRGDDVATLAARMAACDLHVLPFHCAGWELTVLETGACGVANIITEAFSPAQYAAPFSRLVPVGSYVLERDVRALMDTDLGLAALLDLIDDPASRAHLARCGPTVASALDWHRVGEMWEACLRASVGEA